MNADRSPAPDRIEVFDVPTAEMRFWDRALDVLLPPSRARREGPLRRAVSAFTVVPFVNVTPFSVDWQLYLLLLFHRAWLARLGHAMGIPLASLALFTLAAALPTPLAVSWATVLAAVVVATYVVLGVAGRVRWLGVAVAPTVVALALVGRVLAARLGVSGAIALVAGAGALLSASHALEPFVPPRINGSDRWIPLDVWLRPDGRFSIVRLFFSVLAFLAGIVDELCAALRLLPLLHLLVAWRLGFDRSRRDRLVAWVERAHASENPALDYIGIGGATRIEVALERTIQAKNA